MAGSMSGLTWPWPPSGLTGEGDPSVGEGEWHPPRHRPRAWELGAAPCGGDRLRTSASSFQNGWLGEKAT